MPTGSVAHSGVIARYPKMLTGFQGAPSLVCVPLAVKIVRIEPQRMQRCNFMLFAVQRRMGAIHSILNAILTFQPFIFYISLLN